MDDSTFSCQGPIDAATHLPSEKCGLPATASFFSPHKEGVAFLFACGRHTMEIGAWAGRRFGGTFGGEIAKARAAMKLAATRYPRVDTPHGEEFNALSAVPGAPRAGSQN